MKRKNPKNISKLQCTLRVEVDMLKNDAKSHGKSC